MLAAVALLPAASIDATLQQPSAQADVQQQTGQQALQTGKLRSAQSRQPKALVPEPDAQPLGTVKSRQNQVLTKLPLACLPQRSTFMMEETRLTLDDIAQLSASPECQTAQTEGAATLRQLQSRLDTLQQSPECPADKLVAVEPFNTGWGGTMHSMIKPLMKTVADGTTMLTPSMPGWTGEACGNSFACFFQPLAPTCEGVKPAQVLAKQRALSFAEYIKVWGTAFDGEDARADYAFTPQLPTFWQRRQGTPGHTPTTVQTNYVNQNTSYRWHGDSVIPADFRSAGWFWYTVHLQGYLFRPSDRLQAKLDEAMAETGLAAALQAGPVIGMHVRHGDSCTDNARGRQCQHLAFYMQYAERLRARTGASTIYLATDDEKVLAQTAAFPTYTFLRYPPALDVPKKLQRKLQMPVLWWDVAYKRNVDSGMPEENLAVAEAATLEMMMLARTDLFIGKMTSNFYRTAIELKAASCDCMPAFVSLDSPWCFDFSIMAGTDMAPVAAGGTPKKNSWLC